MTFLTSLDLALDRLCGRDLVALLQDLVRIDTTYPPGQEHRLAQFVAGRLEATGLDVSIDPFDDGRANLVARLRGTDNRRALGLLGHFDTAPIGHGTWCHPPHGAVVEGGRLYGRGTADMKAGVAAMMVAVEALAQTGTDLAGDVVLALTSGETYDCIGAKRLVAAGHLDDLDAVMVGEPTGLDVGIAEKSALWLRVTALGHTGHTAQPVPNANAIETMVRFLGRLADLDLAGSDHPILDPPTLAVGTISGGVSVNVTPDHCETELDLRLLPDQDEKDVTSSVRALALPGMSVEVIDFKPAVVTSGDEPLVRAARSAHQRVLGVDPVPIGLPYFTDAAVICPRLGIPMVIMGPGGHGMSHQVDEYCELDSLESAARIYAHTIVEFLA